MSLKTDIIAFGVRLVADNTSLINKPSGIQTFVDTLIDGETYDYRIAHKIENEAARVINAAKRANTTRKFKKIVENV